MNHQVKCGCTLYNRTLLHNACNQPVTFSDPYGPAWAHFDMKLTYQNVLRTCGNTIGGRKNFKLTQRNLHKQLEVPRQLKCRRNHCLLPIGPVNKQKQKWNEKTTTLNHRHNKIRTPNIMKTTTNRSKIGRGELPPRNNCSQHVVGLSFPFTIGSASSY